MPLFGIVVCSTQRSGSTLVCSDIFSTDVLGTALDLVYGWQLHEDIRTKYSIDEYLRSGRTENGFFSLKIMADQLQYLCNYNGKGNSYLKNSEWIYSLFSDCLFVYVARDDVASQAISRLRAKSTGIYHSTQNNSFLLMADNTATKSSEVLDFDICNGDYHYKYLDQIVSVSLEKPNGTLFLECTI